MLRDFDDVFSVFSLVIGLNGEIDGINGGSY